MMDEQTKGTPTQSFCIRFTYKTSTGNNSCNHSTVEQTYYDDTHLNEKTLDAKTNQNKLYKFIQPQNHKSSLFVNLTDIRDINQKERNENHLFISPDLNKSTSASPPSSSTQSTTLDLDSNSSYALDDTLRSNPTDRFTEEDKTKSDNCSTMSQGCNFINSYMAASRRRSASVTPQPPSATKTAPNNNNGRRASSSDDLADVVESGTLAGNRSASGNHLAVGASTETICDTSELTQTNCHISNRGYIQQDDLSKMQALRIETSDTHSSSDIFYKNHPVCLDDILQIDLDGIRLEEECRKLENQVQYWEQKVEELERKRFTDDVNSKFAVEKVLKQRKKLRDLEFEIYKLNLESEDSDRLSSNNLSPYNDDYEQHMNSHLYQISDYESRNNHHEMVENSFANTVDSKIITSRFGSHIRPGQENTADILEAIPPSGALQHRQYLSKASSGTDSSEYSQLPTYDRHRHQLHLNNHDARSSDSNEEGEMVKRNNHLSHVQSKRNSSKQSSLRRRVVEEEREKESRVRKLEAANHQHHTNLERENNRRRASPIRPNHFKDEFGSPHLIPKQDSSSTTTSGSPSH